jgi:hypothetical protein
LAKITALPPKEWRELPWNKRIHLLVQLFLMRCRTVPLFVNGKLSPDYVRVRKYFESRPNEEVNVIYDYVSGLTEKKIMSFQEVYRVAEINRKRLIFEAEKKKLTDMKKSGKIKEYKDITIGDIMGL